VPVADMERAADRLRHDCVGMGSRLVDRMLPVVSEGIEKAVGPIWPTARGLWLRAVLPPGHHLEEGTDLPRSAAPMGATVRTKRSIWLISSPTSIEVIEGRGTRAGRRV